MGMTVHQFKCALEEMRTVYNFDDNETRIGTENLITKEHDRISLETRDKQTGVMVYLQKVVCPCDYVERDPRTNEVINKEDYD